MASIVEGMEDFAEAVRAPADGSSWRQKYRAQLRRAQAAKRMARLAPQATGSDLWQSH